MNRRSEKQMTIDAVQTSLSGVKTSLQLLRENAQDIASVTTEGISPDLPAYTQVVNITRNDAPDVYTRRPVAHNSKRDIVMSIVENVELSSIARAQIGAVDTALDLLGQVAELGQHVNVRA